MPPRIAVVLFNLGGPDGLTSVFQFLYNLFSDKAILNLPYPFRQCLAFLIASLRSRKAKNIYKQMGGKSCIYEETLAQVEELESYLNIYNPRVEHKVFMAMRYWHPMTNETAKNVKLFNPDQIVLLPLYPQFSKSTTGSSLEAWKKAATELGLDKIETHEIHSYPTHPAYIISYGDIIREYYLQALQNCDSEKKPIILFSAHGLPMRNIMNGDPYQQHVESTARSIYNYLASFSDMSYFRDTEQYIVCYQSKVGLMKWLGPSLEETLEKVAPNPVVVVPLSFVSEHSETKVELDITFKEFAQKRNMAYTRVPTPSASPGFIRALSDIIYTTPL